jgi:beta-lactamase regulating signal transducer with metallopeptidase domain
MIERLVEYLVNAVWQLPLLALGAWVFLRAVRLRPSVQHGVWLAVLGLGVLLPLARVRPVTVRAPREMAARSVDDERLARVRVDEAVLVVGAAPERVKADGWMRGVWRRRSLRVGAGVARGIAGCYLVVMLMGLARILLAWVAARRMVGESQEILLSDRAQELVEECGRRVGVERPVVAESAAVSSPAIVGVFGPVMLVPEGFAGYAEEEMRAVLLHEMAHIRRRDYGANLVCEVVALPVVWHPVAHAVRRRIRSTREMVCDGIAAEAMGSTYAYALSLIELAKACIAEVEVQPMAVGLFTNHNLEERVMQLMETKQAMGVRAKAVRVMVAAVGMVAVVALAVMVHVSPAMAQAAAVAPSAASQQAPTTAGPAGAPVAVGPTSAPAAEDAAVGGVSVPPADVEVVPKGVAKEEKSADEALAMAHGDGAKVEPQEGAYVHRWTAADGQPFEVLTREAAEPTAEEKRRFEAEFAERAADLDQLKLDMKLDDLKGLKGFDEAKVELDRAEALKVVDDVKLQMELKKLEDDPKLKIEIRKLEDPKFQMELKEQMDDLQGHLGDIKIDDVEMQKQLRKMNSEDIRRQMAIVHDHLAESEVQRMKIQKDFVKVQDKAIKEQMADLDRQLNVTKQEIDKQVKTQVQREVREQLEEARKHLEEARREMDDHAKDLKAAPCTAPCSAQPQ